MGERRINNLLNVTENSKDMIFVNPYRFKQDNEAFVFTIDTSLGTGDSMQLPLRSGYNYNFIVDWGDGSQDTITTYNQAETLHTYSTGGIYQISIRGLCEAWYFNNGGDKEKLISIDQWGNTGFIDMLSAFNGCSNLTTADDTANKTWAKNVINFRLAFANSALTSIDWENMDLSACGFLNQIIQNSNVTYFSIKNAITPNLTKLRQLCSGQDGIIADISGIDTSNLNDIYRIGRAASNIDIIGLEDINLSLLNNTDFSEMFGFNGSLITSRYDLVLVNWNINRTDWSGITLNFGNSQYTLGSAAETARSQIIANGATIIDGGGI
jgi:hypothetical protein